MACMSHIVCLEMTLSKIRQLPDEFWVGGKRYDTTVLPKSLQTPTAEPGS